MNPLQRKIKRRALLDLSLSPYLPTMSVYDPLDRCQADAGTGELRCPVESLKRAEKTIGVGRVESSAVITNEIGGAPVAMHFAKLHTGGRTLRGKLASISQEVF